MDSIWPISDHKWLEAPSEGLSGGLLLPWKTSILQQEEYIVNRNWIGLRCSVVSSGAIINIINVYGPHEVKDKEKLWKDLSHTMDSHKDEPFILMGDFNCVRQSNERENCSYGSKDSDAFNNFIVVNNLWEVPLHGFKFTWFGSKSKKSKLDRVFLNNCWPLEGDWILQGKCRKNSDHIPILMSRKLINWGPIPFKAYDFWLNDQGFLNWWKDSLASMTHNPKGNFDSWRLVRKLIKSWSQKSNRDLDKSIKIAEKDLDVLDKSGGVSSNRWDQFEELQRLYAARESMIKQKARLKWELEGDSNSKVFHRFLQFRRSHNKIHGIWNNNVYIADPREAKEVFLNHFSNLFNQRKRPFKCNLQALKINSISKEVSDNLVKPISLQEVERALNELGHNKAPGPDGLNGGYVKFVWNVIKDDFMQVISNFQVNLTLPSGLNSSFIALVPKVSTPKEVGDFRPISLINFTMKLILKSLATRLAGVMGSLVSDNQSAFIKGRYISDGILIANEVAHSILSGKCGGLILKIDSAKAFDSIN